MKRILTALIAVATFLGCSVIATSASAGEAGATDIFDIDSGATDIFDIDSKPTDIFDIDSRAAIFDID